MAKAKDSPARVQLRRATAEDVISVFKLVKKYRMDTVQFTPEHTHGAITYLLECISAGHVRLATLEGRVIGVIGSEKPTTAPDNRQVYGLSILASDPAFKSQGTLDALLKSFLTFLKKQDAVLKTIPVDAEQTALLKAHGARAVAVIYEFDGKVSDAEQQEKPEHESVPDGPADGVVFARLAGPPGAATSPPPSDAEGIAWPV